MIVPKVTCIKHQNGFIEAS